MISREYHWYVLYVKRHHEKRAFSYVEKIGVETLLPLNSGVRQWSDRVKTIETPVFPSYLFVRASCVEYFEVLKHPSVLRYVCFKGEPAIVPAPQIDVIKEICNQAFNIEATMSEFEEGESVIVSHGSFCGITGELIQGNGKNRKIRIAIDIIGYSLLLTLPDEYILRLPS